MSKAERAIAGSGAAGFALLEGFTVLKMLIAAWGGFWCLRDQPNRRDARYGTGFRTLNALRRQPQDTENMERGLTMATDAIKHGRDRRSRSGQVRRGAQLLALAAELELTVTRPSKDISAFVLKVPTLGG